ncbi:major facilitator superfamily domain-containing protein [Gautieria morchelliformis]|nr:major facilitator superfamily domain-containing protein [Gautieria morchelliformis]
MADAASETRPLLAPNNHNGLVAGAAPLPSYTSPGEGLDGDSVEAPPHSGPPSEESGEQARLLPILLPVSLGIFLAAMDGTIVASSYASIGSDLKQLQNTSWIATGYMLTLTSIQPLYGKLSDIFGRKACLLFAYSVFGIGCLACGLARNMTELIIARALTGVGGGGMTTVVSILVTDLVPLRRRGTWQGILNIIFSIGSASGAPLGGFLADGGFSFQVPVAFLAFSAVLLALRTPTPAALSLSIKSKLRRIDFLGAFTLVIAIFSLLLGLDRGSNISWSSPTTLGSFSAFCFLTVAFAVIETTPWLAKEPFAPKRIMANASLLGSYLTNFFIFAASVCSLFHVSLYAQAVRGKSAAGAAATLLPCILAGVSGSLLAGCGVGLVMGLLLIDIMALLSTNWSLIGVSIGIAVTTTLIALIANVSSEDQAVATAVSYLFRSLGGVIGISAGSAVVQNTLRVCLTSRLTGPGHDIDEIVRRVRESLSYVDTLDPGTRVIVRGSYEQALLATFVFSTIMGTGGLLASLFIREKSLGTK